MTNIYDCYIIFNYDIGDYIDMTFESWEDAEEYVESEGLKDYIIEGTELG